MVGVTLGSSLLIQDLLITYSLHARSVLLSEDLGDGWQEQIGPVFIC